MKKISKILLAATICAMMGTMAVTASAESAEVATEDVAYTSEVDTTTAEDVAEDEGTAEDGVETGSAEAETALPAEDEKGSPDTGVAGVAGIAGIAVLAAGTMLIAKKSK